jgi:beta-carotene hydroxylase
MDKVSGMTEQRGPERQDAEAALRAAIGPRPDVDILSTAVVVVMTLGFPLIGAAHHFGYSPWWLTLIVGVWLMNLSFTAWHEPAHQTLARSRTVNVVAGWVASFASVYPGYFARRREHLVHHRWEGEDGYDPVYPRIQTDFWGFLPTLAKTALSPPPDSVPAGYLPLTTGQKISDAASNLSAASVVAAAAIWGFLPAVFWAWLAPRLLVYAVHAYYICFFPHHVPAGGYVKYRVGSDSRILAFLTCNQNLHGIHHRWPWIPWHRYGIVRQKFPELLRAEGFDGIVAADGPATARHGLG